MDKVDVERCPKLVISFDELPPGYLRNEIINSSFQVEIRAKREVQSNAEQREQHQLLQGKIDTDPERYAKRAKRSSIVTPTLPGLDGNLPLAARINPPMMTRDLLPHHSPKRRRHFWVTA
eukprot:1843662-Pyramimonas_sp.AAC.1